MKKKYLSNFIPTFIEKTIFDINFTKLYANNKKYILIDLDNTIIPYDIFMPTNEILNLINSIKNIGFTIMIVSNNKKKRVKIFADACNIQWISSAKKPLKFGFKKAFKKLNNPSKEEVITIGDQIMTDILGSSRMNIDSILIHPLKKKTEKWYTKLNRIYEKKVIKKIEKNYPQVFEELKEKHEY